MLYYDSRADAGKAHGEKLMNPRNGAGCTLKTTQCKTWLDNESNKPDATSLMSVNEKQFFYKNEGMSQLGSRIDYGLSRRV